MIFEKTAWVFDYPDGESVEVTTRTKIGAYWAATRRKGPVEEGVSVRRVTQTFTGGGTEE